MGAPSWGALFLGGTSNPCGAKRKQSNDARSAIHPLQNFLWMVALPAFVGVAVNRGWKARASMMVALVAVSLVSSVLIGVNFTTYG